MSTPGRVEAMTIQPISAGLALSAWANSGSTGVFDSVELNIASPPMRAIRKKKERWPDFMRRWIEGPVGCGDCRDKLRQIRFGVP